MNFAVGVRALPNTELEGLGRKRLGSCLCGSFIEVTLSTKIGFAVVFPGGALCQIRQDENWGVLEHKC